MNREFQALTGYVLHCCQAGNVLHCSTLRRSWMYKGTEYAHPSTHGCVPGVGSVSCSVWVSPWAWLCHRRVLRSGDITCITCGKCQATSTVYAPKTRARRTSRGDQRIQEVCHVSEEYVPEAYTGLGTSRSLHIRRKRSENATMCLRKSPTR